MFHQQISPEHSWFREYIAMARKWWWLLAAATLITFISSFLTIRAQPSVYLARATVMIGNVLADPNPGSMELGLAQQLARIYANLALREPIREAAKEALGLRRLPDYTVRVVPNTHLLEIVVTDTDPKRAQAVANELTRQMILQSPTTPQQEEQQRLEFINQQLNNLMLSIIDTQEEIANRQQELEKLVSARQIAETQEQIGALQDKLLMLQANYANLHAGTRQGVVNSIVVYESAPLPTFPIGPNRVILILLATTLGFAIAAVTIYAIELLDDRLKNPDRIQDALGLGTLGIVPMVETKESSGGFMGGMPDHPITTEAYRIVQTKLEFAAQPEALCTVLITSPDATEKRASAAANLSKVFAFSGRKVILVDADFSHPEIHRFFNLSNKAGLTTILAGEDVDLSNQLHDTKVPGLRVLTAGPVVGGYRDTRDWSRLQDLPSRLLEHADIVVVNGPPASAVADIARLAQQVDGVVLLVDASRTQRDTAIRAGQLLQDLNARLLGVVLDSVPLREASELYYFAPTREPDSTIIQGTGPVSDTQVYSEGDAKSKSLSFLKRERTV